MSILIYSRTTNGSRDKSKKKLETYLKTNENTTHKNVWDTAKAVFKRQVYNNKCLH